MPLTVAKDSSNPVFLKLVLQGLSADWKVDKDLLTTNLSRSVRQEFAPSRDDSDLLESSASNTVQDSDDDGTSRIQFQPSPSPPPSPDQCYVSADSLSSIGGLVSAYLHGKSHQHRFSPSDVSYQ